jgi:hypothetical protein
MTEMTFWTSRKSSTMKLNNCKELMKVASELKKYCELKCVDEMDVDVDD